MTILINSVTRPSSCNHVHVAMTINGSVNRTLIFTTEELRDEMALIEARDALLARIRSHVLENNLTTPVQIRNGLEGQTFRI